MRFKALQERMRVAFWRELEPEFRRLVRAADAGGTSTYACLREAWVATLVRIGQDVFQAASDHVGPQSDALKMRVEAQDACQKQLSRRKKEWTHE